MSSLLKPVEWVGSSLEDLKDFPEEVQQVVGYALYLAQCGEKHPSAKPLKGFKGARVLEVVEDFDGDTYRTVYTVKLAGVIYVLHAFQKKSKQGIATPKQDIDLIETRLKRAQEHYAENYHKQQKGEENDSGN
ncbi:type II toxin-antitoxin system RelE/ParE family toxin [Allocoleopsis franciscana]|uniref:Phage-related protein n=1 Tax=Allocoleopsis franciscana PCC 7113 TaxID=1173027 RepID=K9W8L2_9CYAN|nr:type II toxin-antitoxin system RelE/ParE family toxin [Allocoleopsis franciscana]AFZ16141.1 phage-related protein [Allocoleopsis franciscana PCC 7113]